MKKLLQIALGIIAAIGGYLDIGDLVFNVQAGAKFGYQLLWALPVGLLGIMVFAEMSGRVAAIAKQANFELVTERYGRRLATATLVSSLILTFLTLTAELGGVGLVLQLFFDGPDYSSGAREEGWTEEDLGVNRANAILGYGLGATIAVGLLVMAAQAFNPAGVDPSHIGTPRSGPSRPTARRD